jgi:hypothetical protein
MPGVGLVLRPLLDWTGDKRTELIQDHAANEAAPPPGVRHSF